MRKAICAVILAFVLCGMSISWFYIQRAGWTNGTITVPNDYPTIQGAIDNANEGDIVFVRTGTYFEHLTINKSISLIGENKSTTVIDGGQASKVVYVTSDFVTIEGLTVQNGGFPYYQSNAAIFLESSSNIISNNIIAKNRACSIWLDSSSNDNYIAHNVITNNWMGCLLSGNHNNTLVENEIADNSQIGISLSDSSNNSVASNMIANNGGGIEIISNLHPSSNNSLVDNCLTENLNGIRIYASPHNTMRNNTFNSNYNSIQVSGFMYLNNQISYFIQDIDESNTIDGRPIIYLVNHHDEQIKSDAAYVALVDCTNMTARNLQLHSNSQGIVIAGTENSMFQNLNVTYNTYGIYLFKSYNNTIQCCNVDRSIDVGIALENSSSNIIDNNNVMYTYGEGIILGWSNQRNNITNNNISNNKYRGVFAGLGPENTIAYNTVRDNGIAGIGISSDGKGTPEKTWVHHNNIINNTCGVQLGGTSWNVIYNNNFLNNKQQASDSVSIGGIALGNVWDIGYPAGGNYWSDYNGTDFFSGSNQNETGSDGIGDTAYTINIVDRYPLMKISYNSLCDLNHDGRVDIRDIIIVAKAFGASLGHLNWNAIADLKSDGKVDIIDISIVARHFGE